MVVHRIDLQERFALFEVSPIDQVFRHIDELSADLGHEIDFGQGADGPFTADDDILGFRFYFDGPHDGRGLRGIFMLYLGFAFGEMLHPERAARNKRQGNENL